MSVLTTFLLCSSFVLLQAGTPGNTDTKQKDLLKKARERLAKQATGFNPDDSRNEKPRLPLTKPFAFFAAVKKMPHQKEMLRRLDDLTQMRNIWANSRDWGFDVAGRPQCSNSSFLAFKKGMTTRLFRQGEYLRLIVRDDASAANRAAAYFGASMLPNITDALRVFSYLPYEADQVIRRNGFVFLLPYLKVQLPILGKPNPDPKKKVHARIREFRYEFDLIPFLDLLRAPLVHDRVAGFNALTIVAKARLNHVALGVHSLRRSVLDALASKKKSLALAVRGLVKELDMEDPKREVPEDAEEAKAHFVAILRAHFPEIRLRLGRCDLFPGPKLDTLLASAKTFFAKKNNHFGTWESRKITTPGIGVQHPYGLMIRTLPAELLKLGLREGMLLRNINGTPMMKTGSDVYAFLAKRLSQGVTQFKLEWISAKGVLRGRTYNVNKDW